MLSSSIDWRETMEGRERDEDSNLSCLHLLLFHSIRWYNMRYSPTISYFMESQVWLDATILKPILTQLSPLLSHPFKPILLEYSQINTTGIFSNQYYWNILKPIPLEYSQTHITGIFSKQYYWNVLKLILLEYSQTNTTEIFSNQYHWNILKPILLEYSQSNITGMFSYLNGSRLQSENFVFRSLSISVKID